MPEILPALLLLSCLATGVANRIYVHPFGLFAYENATCEAIQTEAAPPLETLPLAAIEQESDTPPPPSDPSAAPNRQNATQRTEVLAELLNSLGLRMYQALSRSHRASNTLLSPVHSFGALVTFYLGASKKTAIPYQVLLGLHRETDRPDCVSLMDGHKVLRTLRGIVSLVAGPGGELRTQAWAFVAADTDVSRDFVQGMRELVDRSYARGVDFSQAKAAEAQVNAFIRRTARGQAKDTFQDVGPATNLLFASSVRFHGNWSLFHPEATSVQEFRVDERTTASVPFMTHTGVHEYLNDTRRRCSVLKLGLSPEAFMLLVLPHEGTELQKVESLLVTEVLSDWYKRLKEKTLKLSLPKFSMSATSDFKALLSDMRVEKYLLGSEAHFSRLSTKHNFTIDKVINKVIFEMSEGGPEKQDHSQDGGVSLTVNRPFFFAVVERTSKAIVMLGKVANPGT